jgi:hypothetical protein
MSLGFAEDWILFSALLPLAAEAPADWNHQAIITHALGDIRRNIAEAAALLHDLTELIPTLRRNRQAMAALHSGFGKALDFLDPYVD